MRKSQETDGKMNCRSTNRFREVYEAACSDAARMGKAMKAKTVDEVLKDIVILAANARTHLDVDQNEAKAKMECCNVFSDYLMFCACVGIDMGHMVNSDDFTEFGDDLFKRVFLVSEIRLKRLWNFSEYQTDVFHRVTLDLMSEAIMIHEEIIQLKWSGKDVYTLTDRIFDFLAYMFGNIEDFVSAFDKWREVYGPSQT